MSMSSISNTSQALASYAAQLQGSQPRVQPRETEPKPQERVEPSQGGDRVTLTSQISPGNDRNGEVGRAAGPQAAAPVPANTPQETQSAASKSITQALEAYVQTSLI